MTYSSYLNDTQLHTAADRYVEMYGGNFECADTGDVLLYRASDGNRYISVNADYALPLFTKRLQQAAMHRYRVNLLTLWWVPIDEVELQDIPGFYQRLFQESECNPPSDCIMEFPQKFGRSNRQK